MELNRSSKIYIAGHTGMVGSAVHRLLSNQGFNNIITATSKILDLRNSNQVKLFFKENKPEIVIFAAAKVGGINANIKFPVEFLKDNLEIQNNIISESFNNKVKKFVFLGSSCIYPKNCPQPMKEEYLLSGPLEPTNEGYALAKIAGLKLVEYYSKQYGFDAISLMPCNLYGPNDSFDLEHSHVLSALVRKFVDAKENNCKEVIVWGTGLARREFMHVEDLAKSIIYCIKNYSNPNFINIGHGNDISIKELAEKIANLACYDGKIIFDSSKPDGMLRKCMDVTKMKEINFMPKIDLETGIQEMISIYKELKKYNKI